MIRDIETVLWKEARTVIRSPGSKSRLLFSLVVPLGYFGVVAPLMSGPDFVERLEPWFIAVVLPLLTVVMTAPDSFAGERERHTLRTLLASRLPDSAILYGKLLFAVLTGLVLMLVALLIALITLNIANWGDGLILLSAGRFGAMFVVAILLSLMASGAAVLISLRARTVQQAQQTLVAVVFLVPTVLGPVAFLLLETGASDVMIGIFDALGSPAGQAGMLGGLVILTTILLWLARAKFQRHRLSILQ
jgi:ABC-2 type transport system permease protein